MRLLYRPVRLECHHAFCSICLKQLLRSTINKACPNCRHDLNEFDQENPKIDSKLKAEIARKYPKALKERKVEHAADKEEEKHKIIKKLVVGNDCKSLEKDWKEWTLYLQMDKEGEDVGRYIDRIVVKLHPTFTPPVLEFKKPPFVVTRKGWGVFEIGITLYFQEATKKPPMDITWYLSFREGGRFKIVDLEFDDRYLK
uniref:Uncharacterized protein n=1 Tax=Arcella intermedia TaxID=1963864 RepID=A0A6B2LJL4_9EUKA